MIVFFDAPAATGPGYAGWERHYMLQVRAALTSGDWSPVAGYADVPGQGQTVRYTNSNPTGVMLYRGRVWLSGSE